MAPPLTDRGILTAGCGCLEQRLRFYKPYPPFIYVEIGYRLSQPSLNSSPAITAQGTPDRDALLCAIAPDNGTRDVG